MENRIKFALYLKGWLFQGGDREQLKRNAEKILVGEYSSKMKGSIFCPECYANLFRSPEEKEYASNGRAAYFAHTRGTETDCGLRAKRAEGKKYLTEEDAKRAIQNEELVVVEGFIKDKPIAPNKFSAEYDATPIEEIDGPVTNVPIGRHRGESFKLPSKFKTIRGICNKFDENITRYFYMPNGHYAIQLQDLLKDIENVTDEDDVPRIYYGKIVRSFNAGKTSKNIRMTKLKFSNPGFADFYLKLTDEKQQEKGIDDNSADRVMLMYGKITTNGAGLCIENLGWGEFALLPQKYENLLYY
jgi:hypothetical protein